MTLQASPIDLDDLLAAAAVVAFQLGGLGEIEERVLGPQERSARLDGGVALSVRTGGAARGELGLVAGIDAAATVLGEGDVLERWEPLMAAIVVALTERAGDLDPQDVQVVAPGAGNGPAMDPEAISIGFFLDDQLVAAIGFLPEQSAGVAGMAEPESPIEHAVGLVAAQEVQAAPEAPVFQTLVSLDTGAADLRRMHLLRDVEMGVSVELGRTRMTVRELLALAPGAIVELDKPAGAPVDLLVNGTLMARGEVVVIDEEFAVRITEIVTPDVVDRRRA
jgi:flagellar motor switch protein FliN